ncbi:MAG TPA: tetratricopeptide repeat protein [Mycobacteriales bacterium]|nr:tetratricopeptide repeat protein [Mycobacteriales bacterium]
MSLPDPSRARSLNELVDQLKLLKIWAGNPSYRAITERVNAAWSAAGRPAVDLVGRTTVVDCFRVGRRRLNPELVAAVVQALHDDPSYSSRWRQALRVIGGQSHAASQVQVQDALPPDAGDFVGRTSELRRIRAALLTGAGGEAGDNPVCVITGMAGVGKTRLALRAARELAQPGPTAGGGPAAVLFVNLRGFDPDPGRPAADPAAVLDGFLHLLGVPSHLVPHHLDARARAFRARIAGTRTLLVLDNAADAAQVEPLLPDTADCPVLITSRRPLAPAVDRARARAGHPVLDVELGVFSAGEARDYVARAATGVPVGDDSNAVARIARRCGNLPLALGLVAAHIAEATGWTLTDHADRLDERHADRRLDSAVEAALDLSYGHLPATPQRLLRLTALHPGTDFDVSAAAALAGDDVAGTAALLDDLRRDHLLQLQRPGRYTFHDLVRAYADGRSLDQDSPQARRAALTRLFDYYLAASAAAMDTVYPAESHRRPAVPRSSAATADRSNVDQAVEWLAAERANLVSVVARSGAGGWPTHAIQLSATLFRYLDGGHHTDALAIHSHALTAARDTGDVGGEAHALNNVAAAYLRLGQRDRAIDHLLRALSLFRATGDPAGQARPLSGLGIIATQQRRFGPAAAYFGEALTLCRQAGDTFGEARALANVGDIEARLGRYGPSAGHLQQALDMLRRSGDVEGESKALYILGMLHMTCGRPAEARESLQRALAVFRDIGERDAEAAVLNGLGEAATAADDPSDAIVQHRRALAIAVDIGDLEQQARAHRGLGQAHRTLNRHELADEHAQRASTLSADFGIPDASG